MAKDRQVVNSTEPVGKFETVEQVLQESNQPVENVIVEEDFGAGDPEPEVPEMYRIWLPKDHPGSRNVRLATGHRFNVNRYDDLDQEAAKKMNDYPEKNMMFTKSQIEALRVGYGFKAQKASKDAVEGES